ncbi:MAG: sigma-54-dependent Fis family transcriptional regulator [Azospirillum brasilense]|nr:MAG: sigma-54-dependent Fis family transcriptional regulator [Azospirillum brasilense]
MRLLIVGDLGGQLGTASRIARDRGAKVAQIGDIEGAYRMLCDGQGADIIMVEVHQDIARFAQMLRDERITVPLVACGIEVNAKIAAQAIRDGAKEYIPLPPDEELIAAVLEAISEETHSVIHGSEAMRRTLAMAEQIAPSEASVLITGESGTGKEVIARFIHKKSSRASKPFIAVNCAAIPANLMESELFGHEKGAFTGALSRRLGKFEEANGGTLLLDEISEMDVGLQSKLLRAIQEREIDRVGGSKPVKVNIRILATSNRDLEAEVKKGTFREDLYFRLNVINLMLPSLKDRVDDIPPLADYFVEKYSKANALPPRKLTAEAIAKLKSHPWPGNVRELENIMHRAVLMAQGNVIDEQAILLPASSRPVAAAPQAAPAPQTAHTAAAPRKPNDLVGRTVGDVEKELILDTLDHCLGNRTQAAQVLGISIRTLRNKLKQYQDEGTPVKSATGGY